MKKEDRFAELQEALSTILGMVIQRGTEEELSAQQRRIVRYFFGDNGSVALQKSAQELAESKEKNTKLYLMLKNESSTTHHLVRQLRKYLDVVSEATRLLGSPQMGQNELSRLQEQLQRGKPALEKISAQMRKKQDDMRKEELILRRESILLGIEKYEHVIDESVKGVQPEELYDRSVAKL